MSNYVPRLLDDYNTKIKSELADILGKYGVEQKEIRKLGLIS